MQNIAVVVSIWFRLNNLDLKKVACIFFDEQIVLVCVNLEEMKRME